MRLETSATAGATRSGAIVLTLLVCLGTSDLGAAESGEAPSLAGHWITEVPGQYGEMVEIVLDLGMVNSRWVGEFDLTGYRVQDYPVEVNYDDSGVRLHLTAIGMDFEGQLSEDGKTLSGQSLSQDEVEEVTFTRTGPHEFSEGFLELEAAADDPSLVQKLTSDGAALRDRFNADADKTRLLMLLSPT